MSALIAQKAFPVNPVIEDPPSYITARQAVTLPVNRLQLDWRMKECDYDLPPSPGSGQPLQEVLSDVIFPQEIIIQHHHGNAPLWTEPQVGTVAGYHAVFI